MEILHTDCNSLLIVKSQQRISWTIGRFNNWTFHQYRH